MARHLETLFFITPIGAPDTPERRRSDLLHTELLAPVCDELGIRVQRADWITEPTALLTRILQFVLESEYAVCDFAGGNPNVYYEAGVRHCTGLPTLHLARPGETIPFDLKDQLTLFLDESRIEEVRALRGRVRDILMASRSRSSVLNPVTMAARLSGAQFSLRRGVGPQLIAVGQQPVSGRDWSGLWLTNFGRTLVRQQGTRLSGLFEHHSEGWAGRFTGLAGADALWFAFPLKDSAYPGLARIDPRLPDSYGLWVHSPALTSIEDLQASWEKDARAVRKLGRLWKLYGRLGPSGELTPLDSDHAPQGNYLEFALRNGVDARGRTFQDLLSLTDDQLERDGDALIWLFPDGGPEGSFEGLVVEDYSALRRSEVHRARVRQAFLVILRFYGFQLQDTTKGPRVVTAPNFDQRKQDWLVVGHFHYGRITRVLRFLGSFGFRAEARAWYAALERLQQVHYRGFMRWAIPYWRLAVGLEPRTKPWWTRIGLHRSKR